MCFLSCAQSHEGSVSCDVMQAREIRKAPQYLSRVCQDQLSTKSLEEDTPLKRHGCWHSEDQLIPLGSSYESQTNACVATGGLDKGCFTCKTCTT